MSNIQPIRTKHGWTSTNESEGDWFQVWACMYLNKCGGEVVSQLSESLAELWAVNGAGAISVESLEQVPPLLDEIEQRDELVHLEPEVSSQMISS